jgi:hypothetical protein
MKIGQDFNRLYAEFSSDLEYVFALGLLSSADPFTYRGLGYLNPSRKSFLGEAVGL